MALFNVASNKRCLGRFGATYGATRATGLYTLPASEKEDTALHTLASDILTSDGETRATIGKDVRRRLFQPLTDASDGNLPMINVDAKLPSFSVWHSCFCTLDRRTLFLD